MATHSDNKRLTQTYDMRILVVAPTERENKNIRAAIEVAKPTRHHYTVAFSGIGKAAAAATIAKTILSADEPFDCIAAIGFAAGALGFKQGEIVEPSRAWYHDCDVPEGFIPELTEPRKLLGKDDVTVFTGDSFVNARSVADIKRRFGIERAIYDMEIQAIVIAAEICGKLPVIAVKMISDVPEDGHTEHSYDAFADSHSDFSEILERLERL